MIKQILKLAGVKSEKEFLKKYPTEQSFLNAHPEASMLLNSVNMNYYQDGGEMMMDAAAQGAPPEEGGMPSQQDVAAQQQQIVQFIVQLLQQNIPPPQIIQQLVEAGLPEDEATQLVNAVLQQIEAQTQGPSPEEQMMMQQGQQEPQGEQLAEEPPIDQPMMKMGGKPCYKCGGKYKKGGSTYSGTYSGGVYYAGGGPAFIPDYGMMAMGGSYDNPGFKALPLEVQNKIMQGSKAMYGGSYAGGGMIDDCPPGTEWDEELEECVPIEEGMEEETEGVGNLVPAGTPNPRLNAGFGLGNNSFNADYKFGINPLTRNNVSHAASLSFPNLFRKDKGLSLNANYSPNRLLHADISGPNIPLFGGNLSFNAGADKFFENEKPTPLMQIAGTRPNTRYTAGVRYERELGPKGKKGNLKGRISLNYNSQQYGGLTKFVGGGEMGAMVADDQQMSQEQMLQQLMGEIAQLLEQGAQPEQIIPQLVQMGMSEEEAMQFIQMTAQQMGAGGGQGAVMPMEVGMYGGSYAKGGMIKQYKKGGEYDLTESEIQDLVNKGYKIQYV